MKNKRLILAIALSFIIIPMTFTLLALQNPPWVSHPLFTNVESAVANAILSHTDLVSVPGGQDTFSIARLASPKHRALAAGNVKVLTASEATREGFAPPANTNEVFIIATIEPVDLEHTSETEQREIIQAVDDLAVKGYIDAIVEATSSDIARANEWGKGEARRLRDAGVIRCVIFDGGHHTGTLMLEPDILLVPVTQYNGDAYISHWQTRDAVDLHKLRNALIREDMDCVVARFPRVGAPIKNPTGMAGLAAGAIREIVEKSPGTSKKQATPNTLRGNQATHSKTTQKRAIAQTSPRFIALEANPSETKEAIAKKVDEHIKQDKQTCQTVKRIYLGMTYGTSKFPHISKEVGHSGDELEEYLNRRLPYHVTVLTEPLGVWDIYLKRLGLL